MKSTVLSRPLADYMDRLSLVETVRHRSQLRLRGILPETSKCFMTDEQLSEANLAFLTGDAGLTVLQEYMDFLQCPGGELLPDEFNVSQDECFPLVVIGLCDSWRRLVLPFTGLPWTLFRAINIPFNQGLDYMRSLGLRAGACSHCQDQFFSKVSRLLESSGNFKPGQLPLVKDPMEAN